MRKLLFSLSFFFVTTAPFSQKIDVPKMQAMYDAIKQEGILHPDFVMAQCMQETGNLTCRNCCLRYHNLFGFYSKKNTCKKFDSDADCIKYYKKWQEERYKKWRKKFPTEDYYHFLKHVKYATGDKYSNEIKPKLAWVRKHLIL